MNDHACMVCGYLARFSSGIGGPLVCGDVCNRQLAAGVKRADETPEQKAMRLAEQKAAKSKKARERNAIKKAADKAAAAAAAAMQADQEGQLRIHMLALERAMQIEQAATLKRQEAERTVERERLRAVEQDSQQLAREEFSKMLQAGDVGALQERMKAVAVTHLHVAIRHNGEGWSEEGVSLVDVPLLEPGTLTINPEKITVTISVDRPRPDASGLYDALMQAAETEGWVAEEGIAEGTMVDISSMVDLAMQGGSTIHYDMGPFMGNRQPRAFTSTQFKNRNALDVAKQDEQAERLTFIVMRPIDEIPGDGSLEIRGETIDMTLSVQANDPAKLHVVATIPLQSLFTAIYNGEKRIHAERY